MMTEHQPIASEKDDETTSHNNLVTKEKIHHANSKFVETIKKANFNIPRCHTCNKEIQLSEGDIIYGDKWYHKSCWKEAQKIELVSH